MKMPSELYQQLQEEAKRKGLSVAALIRMVCSEYLESEKK
jgi:predicted DNA-binding protein